MSQTPMKHEYRDDMPLNCNKSVEF